MKKKLKQLGEQPPDFDRLSWHNWLLCVLMP